MTWKDRTEAAYANSPGVDGMLEDPAKVENSRNTFSFKGTGLKN
jgi:hypothetical protein